MKDTFEFNATDNENGEFVFNVRPLKLAEVDFQPIRDNFSVTYHKGRVNFTIQFDFVPGNDSEEPIASNIILIRGSGPLTINGIKHQINIVY